ncbi:hypothetical protein D3C75_1284810 [compost metagenome]
MGDLHPDHDVVTLVSHDLDPLLHGQEFQTLFISRVIEEAWHAQEFVVGLTCHVRFTRLNSIG